MNFNFKVVAYFISILLMINSFCMFLCLPFSLYYNEHEWKGIVLSGSLTLVFALYLMNTGRNNMSTEIKKKDGYLIVTLGWLSMTLFGALPYVLTGEISHYTDAVFETISGYSTTGASVITDLTKISKGILFWRSLTQWIGGMGIIVLTVAILPILGIGGMQLFVAEAPGISPDKLKPRIQDTASRLWLIYLSLTSIETVLLMFGGMSFYDAINHSLTTMATGGFSTQQDSAASFSPYIQYVLIIFMFFAGCNFTLLYFGAKRRFSEIFRNEEFRYYVGVILAFTIVITTTIVIVSDNELEKSFRDALFQVISVVTTTGFVSADYTSWAPFVTVLIFLLFFFGGTAGSTAGGVKIVRLVILTKNSFLELKRQLHPNAVIPVRFNGKAVTQDITYNVLAFIMIYISLFALGSALVALTGMDFSSSIGAVATCLGNIGPGIGTVGPVDNFAHVPLIGKWILSFYMLLGRLELFTVLMLFTPHFWMKY